MNIVYQTTEHELLTLIRRAVREEINFIPKESASPIRPPATRLEAAKYLGLSLPTLDQLIKSGQLASFNIGRQVRVKFTDLEAYVNGKGANT